MHAEGTTSAKTAWHALETTKRSMWLGRNEGEEKWVSQELGPDHMGRCQEGRKGEREDGGKEGWPAFGGNRFILETEKHWQFSHLSTYPITLPKSLMASLDISEKIYSRTLSKLHDPNSASSIP